MEGRVLLDNMRNDPVRQVAIQALRILTHQTKGYESGGDATARSASVAAWRRWLVEYRANL
jgi:uncharacterized protein HemX